MTTKFQCPCSCGETKPHTVMKRQTADGTHVYLWENGAITGSLGLGLHKVPLARPRNLEGAQKALRIGRQFMEWVSCYTYAELPALYTESKKKALSVKKAD